MIVVSIMPISVPSQSFTHTHKHHPQIVYKIAEQQKQQQQKRNYVIYRQKHYNIFPFFIVFVKVEDVSWRC